MDGNDDGDTVTMVIMVIRVIRLIRLIMVIGVIRLIRVTSVKSSIGILTHQGHISKVNENAHSLTQLVSYLGKSSKKKKDILRSGWP